MKETLGGTHFYFHDLLEKRWYPQTILQFFFTEKPWFALHFPSVSRLWSQLGAASCRCSQRFGATDVAKATWAFAKHLGVMWMWGSLGDGWMWLKMMETQPDWMIKKWITWATLSSVCCNFGPWPWFSELMFTLDFSGWIGLQLPSNKMEPSSPNKLIRGNGFPPIPLVLLNFGKPMT